MNLKQLEQYFISETASIDNAEESIAMFYVLADHLDGWGRSFILMNKELIVNNDKLIIYTKIIEELKTGKPLQYILGKTIFYGLSFKVNENVLIPRPETEELVEWILTTVNKNPSAIRSILDIGTGTGCIPIVLKKQLKDIEISALDISVAALQIAKENADLNGTQIIFINSDILTYSSDIKYDIIVSNPPYIKENEQVDMTKQVLDHEPHLALFVSNEHPLVFYEAIAEFAIYHLNPKGKLFFEINAALGRETVAMLKSKGFNAVVLKKDMQGKDRMISCSLPG